MKNPNDTNWNQTSDLMICSTTTWEPLCYRGHPLVHSLKYILGKIISFENFPSLSAVSLIFKCWSWLHGTHTPSILCQYCAAARPVQHLECSRLVEKMRNGRNGRDSMKKIPNKREYSGSNKGKRIKPAENSFKGMSSTHYIFYHQFPGRTGLIQF